MKYPLSLAVALAAIAVPSAVSAQDVDEERVQYLTCRLADVCGEVAVADYENDVVALDEMDLRGGLLGPDEIKRRARGESTSPVRAEASKKPKLGASKPVAAPRQGRATTATQAAFKPAVEVSEELKGKADLFVTFELNSARLTKDAMKDIGNLAEAIRRADASGKTLRYRIAGHTDSSGTDEINEKLSADRAAAVRAALEDAGVDPARLESAGYGSREPVEGYDKSHGINRRVEAVVITE